MKFIFGLLLFSSLLFNNIEATKFPKCSGCTVYATGKDGVVWGWEEDNFCKISSSKCGITIRKSTTIRKSSTTTTSTTSTSSTSGSTSTPVYDSNGNVKCNGCEITSTKSDKTLWGQENGKPCIIDENKCEEKLNEIKEKNEASQKTDVSSDNKKDSDGNTLCKGCQVVSTGNDNTLWGKENGTSCKIDETLCKNKTDTQKNNNNSSNTKIGFSRVGKVEVESSAQNINMNHLYAAIAILTIMVLTILL